MYIAVIMNNFSKDLIAASTIPIVLLVLNQGESYGYAIIQKVKDVSGGDLLFADGTLYPVLRKLEDRELIRSEWRVAENEKRRRYYLITEKGREQLKNEQSTWKVMNNLLNQLWKASPVV